MFGGASEATIHQMLTSGLKPLHHFCTMLYWNIQVVCGFIFVHGLFIWCTQKKMSSLRRSSDKIKKKNPCGNAGTQQCAVILKASASHSLLCNINLSLVQKGACRCFYYYPTTGWRTQRIWIYLDVHIEEPCEVAFSRVLVQRPDDNTGRSVFGSVSTQTHYRGLLQYNIKTNIKRHNQ